MSVPSSLADVTVHLAQHLLVDQTDQASHVIDGKGMVHSPVMSNESRQSDTNALKHAVLHPAIAADEASQLDASPGTAATLLLASIASSVVKTAIQKPDASDEASLLDFFVPASASRSISLSSASQDSATITRLMRENARLKHQIDELAAGITSRDAIIDELHQDAASVKAAMEKERSDFFAEITQMHGKLEEQAIRISIFDETVANMQDSFDTELNDAVQLRTETMQSQIETAEANAQASDAKVSECLETSQRLQVQVRELEERNAELSEIVTDLKEQVAMKAAEIAEQGETVENLTVQIEELQDRNAQLAETATIRAAEMDDMRHKLQTAESTAANLEVALKQQETAHVQQVAQVTLEAGDKLERMLQACQKQNDASMLQAETVHAADIAEKTDVIAHQAAEIAQLEGRLADKDEAMDGMQTLLASLEEQLEDITRQRDASIEAVQLGSTNEAQLKAIVAALTSDLDNAKSQAASLETEKHELISRVGRLTCEAEDLSALYQDALGLVAGRDAAIEQQAAQVAQLSSQIAETDKQTAVLRASLAALTLAKTSIEEQLAKVSADFEEFKAQTNARDQEAIADFENVIREQFMLQERHRITEASHEQLQEQVLEFSRIRDDYESRLAGVVSELEQYERAISAIADQIKERDAQEEARVRNLRANFDQDLHAARTTAAEDIQNLRDQIVVLTTRNDDLVIQMDENDAMFERRLGDTKMALDVAHLTIDSQTLSIEEKDARIQALESDVQVMNAQIIHAKGHTAELEMAIETLKSQVQSAETQKSQVASKIASLVSGFALLPPTEAASTRGSPPARRVIRVVLSSPHIDVDNLDQSECLKPEEQSNVHDVPKNVLLIGFDNDEDNVLADDSISNVVRETFLCETEPDDDSDGLADTEPDDQIARPMVLDGQEAETASAESDKPDMPAAGITKSSDSVQLPSQVAGSAVQMQDRLATVAAEPIEALRLIEATLNETLTRAKQAEAANAEQLITLTSQVRSVEEALTAKAQELSHAESEMEQIRLLLHDTRDELAVAVADLVRAASLVEKTEESLAEQIEYGSAATTRLRSCTARPTRLLPSSSKSATPMASSSRD
ncbi:hypothetical protein BC831DRAFT_305031 [Entophlyctis helioformis]|nr:hypothetical protein BC831DRAFT_305031 [Entophlyctis helioformis]